MQSVTVMEQWSLTVLVCCNLRVFIVTALHPPPPPPPPPEVPSAPSIEEVRPFSTTALIQFMEPESTGGVPVLKYRAQWRMRGRGSWVQKVYEVQDGNKRHN